MSVAVRSRGYPFSLLFSLLILLCILNTSLFSQERFRRNPPFPDPLPELTLPKIESASLSNGLEVSIIRRQDLPVISIHLIVYAGESFSPDALPGLATFTANMVNKGAVGLSSSRITETIETIGGKFSSETHPDYSVISFTFLEDYLDTALETLGKMILQPTFPRIEVRNVVRTMHYDLLGRKSSPAFVGRRTLLRILFEEHPYRNIAFNETVTRNLNRDELLSFFEKYYRPNNAKLILIGNLTLRTAVRKVSRYLNTWENKDIETEDINPPQPNETLKLCIVDLPEEEDATITIGNTILLRDYDDYFPTTVLNQVLGGSPHSRLFMNLRESKGYAYFAFSTVEFFKACGILTIQERVRPNVIFESIAESLNEISRISSQVVPDYELEQAKSYLIGNFPLRIEDLEYYSSRLAAIQAFELGEAHWDSYYQSMMLISPENVYEIARQSSLQSPVVVVVGNIQELSPYLQEFDLEVYDTNGEFQYTIKKGETE
ncbi:MAG: peptidase M16 [Candidatus Aminicenantes bacterium]|nr:peptidase M16 [Candidatus Aminicenantes bacterium]